MPAIKFVEQLRDRSKSKHLLVSSSVSRTLFLVVVGIGGGDRNRTVNKGFAEIICGHPPVNTEEQGRAKFNSLCFVMFFLGRLCVQV